MTECRFGHTFPTRAKPGGTTTCPTCRVQGRRIPVRIPVCPRDTTPPFTDATEPSWLAETPWDGQARHLWRGVPEAVTAAHTAVERARQPSTRSDPLDLLRQERAFERQREQVVRAFLARADECDPDEIEDDDLYDAVIEDPRLADRGEALAEEYRALADRARVAHDAMGITVLVRYAKADLEHQRWW